MGLDELEYGLSQLRKLRKRNRMIMNVVAAIVLLGIMFLVFWLAADVSF